MQKRRLARSSGVDDRQKGHFARHGRRERKAGCPRPLAGLMLYMSAQRFLLLGAKSTAFTASSKTVFRFSPVLAEHSKYLTALIFLASSVPWMLVSAWQQYSTAETGERESLHQGERLRVAPGRASE